MKNLLLLLLLLPVTLFAQVYQPINLDLNIYCAQFPDGTRSLAKYEKKTNNIALQDFEEGTSLLQKRILQNKQRSKILNKIVKNNSIITAKGIKKFRQLYKRITSNKYRKDADRVKSQAKKLIRRLRSEIKEYLESIQAIDDCKNKVPFNAVNGANIGVEEISFIHPDFGVLYYMRGIAIKTSLPRKKTSGIGCVAADNPSSAGLGTYPYETQAFFTTDSCSYFSGQITRNPIFCPETIEKNTGILWLDWGITITPLSSSPGSLRQLEAQLERMGNVYVRTYKKKDPCLSKG